MRAGAATGRRPADRASPRRTGRTPFAVALLAAGCGSGGSGGDGPTVTPPAPDPSPPAPTVTAVDLADAFAQLPGFNQPLAMLKAPGDTSRWYVVERAGRVHVFDDRSDVATTEIALDLSSSIDSGPNEAGLLGMAFAPDFQASGAIYLSFTRPGLVSQLSRLFSFDGGASFDAASEQVLLTVPQDFDNHNGGQLAFGQDGFLYAGFGDGGSANDPLDRAQDTANLLGTIVRLDVAGSGDYAVPAGNPFAGNPRCSNGFGGGPCPEIFAWGLRNPWRFSIDAVTGTLWAGDVGQGAREEIDQVVAGANYGWPILEGTRCNDPSGNCVTTGLTPPVAEYDRSVGSSVTGGYVYRGSTLTGLVGEYLYADFVSGRLFALPGDLSAPARELADTNLNVASFGEADDGTLFVIDYSGGRLYRIVDAAP